MEESELIIEKEQLHDSIVKEILIDRKEESVVIRVTTAELYYPETEAISIIAEQASYFTCSMKNPWGRSCSINEVVKKGNRLEIEMQSGDIIMIEAESFKIVKE
ncbi:hypothetical protein C8N40_11720 [Pontibacter mucosus]|uniref:Uncharacterized protein n=1 Tax=Pontibacter mucosus TaxID=1649266 RepID=A0A2T5Y3A7_9BACT|nr:hypothetical protein [Pontibacter mucosus]PTX10519.1 hypothetical protein C8N40_11720 [Pontibacter mucosus]